MNEKMTYAEWQQKLNAADFWLLPNIYLREGKPFIQTYEGKLVCPGASNVVLFEKCNYCGTNSHPKHSLYGGYFCSACGGPVI